MKIAIMTWFQYANYGSVLQVTALKNVLEKKGHQVEIIQYYHGKRMKTLSGKNYISMCWKIILKKLKSYKKNNMLETFAGDVFSEYRDNYLKLTEECETFSDLREVSNTFDLVICGSDQIWSPLCFDSHYFLDFVASNEKIVAYAPSIGVTKIDDKYIMEKMRELISRFNYLSVREESGAEIIKAMTGKEVPVVCDPTLLMKAAEWTDFFNVTNNNTDRYLVTYFLGCNEKHWKLVYKIAEMRGLKIRIIPVFLKDLKRKGEIINKAGPIDFISYIKNAELVCTDSFHGMLFSINFQKQFFVFERFAKKEFDNQNTRIYNILKKFNLESRLIRTKKDLCKEVQDIDYSNAVQKLEVLRKESELFLDNSINSSIASENKVIRKKCVKENTMDMCCGCGACVQVCPNDAIKVIRNTYGFYEAQVNKDLCISCGKCIQVCPFHGKENGLIISDKQLYSYKSGDPEVLKKSSSGGVAYDLANSLINNGYSIIACIFDANEQIAKHIFIDSHNKELITKTQGSKYMQSDFSRVWSDMGKYNGSLAIFGTPCQIASARNLLKNREDVYYIDLICHGVPTYNLYEKYKLFLNKAYDFETEKIDVVFREKIKGWREKYLKVTDTKKKKIFHQKKDLFFRMFEQGNCYSQACYECRWRDRSSADIRIGDYWGDKFKNDTAGVSMIITMTKRGEELLHIVQKQESGCNLTNQSIGDYFRWQQSKNAQPPMFYDEIMNLLAHDENDLEEIVNKYVKVFEKIEFIGKIYGKIKKI